MDSAQQEALVQRLVANPQDQAAIAEAHAAGQADPEGYAVLLEKVGNAATEPAMASHWLSEAANVWITTFSNLHRAASVLMAAVERFPQGDAAAQRLSQLYAEGGDHRARGALCERRAIAVEEAAKQDLDLKPIAARLYEELGQAWSDESLADPDKARAAYVKAVELNPASQFAIYSLRESYKQAGDFVRALPYFAMEQAIVSEPERRLALLLDEAEVAKHAGKLGAVVGALRKALATNPQDPGMKQQFATAVLEKYRGGVATSEVERREAAQLFVALSEEYPGEHGFLYSLCCLELVAGDDRACQLALHYGESLGRLDEVAAAAAGYVQANPGGAMAEQAKVVAGDVKAPPRVEPASLAQPEDVELSESGAVPREAAPTVEPVSEDELADLLDEAVEYAKKSRKNQALAAYKKVLAVDPANEEAIGYLMQQLPPKRKYADLRDTLLVAVDVPGVEVEQQIAWLREAAGLCERQLRDFDTAVTAWKRIYDLNPEEEGALDQYTRLLDRARRWDELADLLQRQAIETEDLEVRIALERNLAKLHSSKRKDLGAAGEAWARIAELTPGDEAALLESVRFFEKAEQLPRVAEVIATNVAELDDPDAQLELYEKLGRLRAGQDDIVGAADALSEGAEKLGNLEMWATAERYYAQAQEWAQAATAALSQKELASDNAPKAAFSAQAAQYLFQVGEHEEALQRLEQAVELEPAKEDYANQLEQRLVAAGRVAEVAALFLGRADKLESKTIRMDLRRRAARLQQEHMEDLDGARDSFSLVLDDGEDSESLAWLADDAETQKDMGGAVEYLARLAAVIDDPDEKLEVLHREARTLAAELEDPDTAIARYETLLKDVDPKNEQAFSQIVELEVAREGFKRAASVLERFATIADTREVKLEVFTQLADIYENKLTQHTDAMRVLKLIHEADPDDFDATQRLCELARGADDWSLVSGLMVELIAVEGDEDEIGQMTQELASILSDKLSKHIEALEVLGNVGDQGHLACREAFMTLGDSIDKKAAVAERMVIWYKDAEHGPERDDALHGAFDRFTESKRDAEAASVAKQLDQSGGAEPELAERLEELAQRLEDLDALAIAHRLKLSELEGLELGEETVRQAEVLARLGVAEAEVFAHGEAALGSVAPGDVEPLLARLAVLAVHAEGRIDLYERQVARCENEEDRLNALCRAAEISTEADDNDRASSFFEVALSGGVHDEAVERIITVARNADQKNKDTSLRSVLADALAGGGQGARDGGKTRSFLLRRAALLANDELDDLERALVWLGDALICHVDKDGLEALLELASAADDYTKAETVLERVLAEVFDGPMVRRLLSCRAELRETHLDDKKAAAQDLKRLLDLSPGDGDVTERLSNLYAEVGDHRGIIQLFEDQILRGRDKESRAELARKVAILWQDELKEPREAADAWRRVLRMKTGDEEAKERLAKAKEQMLNARRRGQAAAAAADASEKARAESSEAPQASEAPLVEAAAKSEDDTAESVETNSDEGTEPTGAEAVESEDGGADAPVQAQTAKTPAPLAADSAAAPPEKPLDRATMPDAPMDALVGDSETTELNGGFTSEQGPSKIAVEEFDESEFDSTRVDLNRGETLPDSVKPPPAETSDESDVSFAEEEPTVLNAPASIPPPLPPVAAKQTSVPPLPPAPGAARSPGPPPRRQRSASPSVAPPLPPPRAGGAPPSRRPPPPPRKD